MNRLWDIDELRKFIKNEASGGISKEEVEQLINDAISKIDIKEKLTEIWKNSDTTIEFKKTNINLLNFEKYTKILIYYYDDIDNNNIYQQLIYIQPLTTSINNNLNILTKKGLSQRNLEIKTLLGRIIFNNCIDYDYINNTYEEKNTNIIPYVIYGIN